MKVRLRSLVAVPLAFAVFLLAAMGVAASTVQMGPWNSGFTYAPGTGSLELQENIISNGASRYINIRGYNMRYTSQQVNNMRGNGRYNAYIVTHAFHNNQCSAGRDRGAWLNGTTYTYSTLPGAHFDTRKQASCDGSGSGGNEIRIWFDKNSVVANQSYQALVEYRDTYWNGTNWPCCGQGNGDNGKLGMDQYTNGFFTWDEVKESMKYGFFCSFVRTTQPGLSTSQCP